MLQWILKKIVGTKNQREVSKLWPRVQTINDFETAFQSLSEEALKAKTAEFRARYEKGETLDALLPEAFAVVKNACRRLTEAKTVASVRGYERVWNMIPFDVQLIGGMVLHSGRISEMATGEGKTLVATLPVYLNALTGKGVHVVTVNDYLAARDAEWMGLVYRYLGLTVGCLQNSQSPAVRREQYQCDITYGTNSEFGFDYLRDNGMAVSAADQVQRGHVFAIVDEVDSILIDEARTPLIISGPTTVVREHHYDKFKPSVESLFNEQSRQINALLAEAEELLKKGENEAAGRLLYKAKEGMPKSKRLRKLLEEPAHRKWLEKSELSFVQDAMREELFKLKEEMFFSIDERSNEVNLSEKGRHFLSPTDEHAFTLPDIIHEYALLDNQTLTPDEKRKRRQQIQSNYDSVNERIHAVSQLLRAFCLYEKDVHYVVVENKVCIVDEYTGRMLAGRRWSDGLHQAVEAKEGVAIESETQTYATITIQNYFRLYKKLAGMTGTAETDASEFKEIYKMDVVVIPTNRVCVRQDFNDVVYKTRRDKYAAIIAELKECHSRKQPVLVGTISVEVSELLSRMLKRDGIPHTVLNAKFHQQEAEIVERAGYAGAITIATNMAGRGTDIKLAEGVADSGGLHVIGTERHESRRIDRQLRGRCARQGDPGSSRFYVSFEDDLMRLFGASEKITALMERFGFKDGEDLQHPWLNKSVETAQKRVEAHNFQIRKRTLEYDDVLNKQREIVYGYRNELLRTEAPREFILEALEEVVDGRVRSHYAGSEGALSPDAEGELLDWVNTTFPLGLTREEAEFQRKNVDEAYQLIVTKVVQAYEVKEKYEDPDALRALERYTVLGAVDKLWQAHLYGMDGLRSGIHLRAYAQRDPLIEYKKEGFEMFEEMWSTVKHEIVNNIFRSATSLMAFENFLKDLPQKLVHQELGAFATPAEQQSAAGIATAGPREDVVAEAIKATPMRREGPKIGRNDPCPKARKNDQGNVLKFKNCCGKEGLESCKFH
ncbi:MAG: preprotein translocase subunit SecA [Verrucomicrobiae bacterium]|nr:preprotein translocase subunit SecA [Verrucomicrobiae bacterium]